MWKGTRANTKTNIFYKNSYILHPQKCIYIYIYIYVYVYMHIYFICLSMLEKDLFLKYRLIMVTNKIDMGKYNS